MIIPQQHCLYLFYLAPNITVLSVFRLSFLYISPIPDFSHGNQAAARNKHAGAL